MAVTTGKTTGSTSGGTSSAKTSSNPSGGGPGGPFGAPNGGSTAGLSKSTSPATGGGGKGTTSSTGSKNPTGGSLSAPARTAPSSSTSKSSSSSSSSAKTASTGSKNPTGGSLQAPARTAPSSGVGGSKGGSQSPSSVSKQKDQYSQYGGAQTSMRAATLGSNKAPSAKVQDPSRGGASLGSFQSVGIVGSRTPSNKSVPQDPSIAGRAAEANKNYTVSTGPGGMVSRTYSDPDLKTNSPGLGEQLMRGLQTAADKITVPMGGPNRGLVQKTVGQQLADAGMQTLGKIGSGISSGITSAGSYLDSLLGPGINPGATTGAMMNTPGMSYDKPIADPRVGYDGQRFSYAGTDPAQALADSFAGDYQRDIANAIMGTRAPSARVLGDTRTINELATDPTNNSPADLGPPRSLMAGVSLPKDMSRVPSAVVQPSLNGVGSSPQSAIEKARQDAFNKIAAARGQGAGYSTPEFDPERQAQAVDRALINTISNNAIKEPASATIAEPPPLPAPLPSTPVRQGSIVNPMYRDPVAQAQAVRNAVALARGPGERVLSVEDVPPERTPASIAINGPGQSGAWGGLGVQAYPGDLKVPPNGTAPGDAPGTSQRDDFYNGTINGEPATAKSPKPVKAASPKTRQPPSQEGDYPPGESPSQVDGQPQNVRELVQRYRYEKERAKQGFKALPGRIGNAILDGDFRPYTLGQNDKRNWPAQGQAPGGQQQAQLADAQTAALLAQLMALLQQQQQGGVVAAPSALDLVTSTFV